MDLNQWKNFISKDKNLILRTAEGYDTAFFAAIMSGLCPSDFHKFENELSTYFYENGTKIIKKLKK